MAEQLLAGWALSNITPPLGSRLRGYYSERLASGVHDPLQAKALWLSDGDETLAVVTCDLCAVDRSVIEAARALVTESTGLPPERLVVQATHTHLGPHSGEHLEFLAGRISEAVIQAARQAGPVAASAGCGAAEGIAFCRRFLMTDGAVRFNPGRRNPDIVGETNPADPRVAVLALERPHHAGGLVVVNFACHLDTIGGTVMSADYPHYLSRVVKAVFGAAWGTLFLQGCSGDINHIDVEAASQPTGFDMAERVGTVLAGEVVKLMARRAPIAVTPLRVRSTVLPIEVEQPTPDELAAAKELRAAGGSDFNAQVRAGRLVSLAAKGSPVPLEITTAHLGEAAFVGLPGEVFSSYGRRLIAQSPSPLTFVTELCHHDVGYFPTPEAMTGGGYETWSTLFPIGTGDRMVGCALDLLWDRQSN